MKIPLYSCYLLSDDSKAKLLELFVPKFDKIFAHHITTEFGENSKLPIIPKTIEVIGYSSNHGIEALVVSIDDNTYRPDGSIYHITWSLNPSEYSPVDSNKLLCENGYTMLDTPTLIKVEPKLFYRQ